MEDDFVVVNKPPGVPTHETLDNLQHNARAALSAHLRTTLLVTHRLDTPTGGLLVFARNQAFSVRGSHITHYSKQLHRRSSTAC